MAREYKWSVEQILKLTPYQFGQFLKWCEPREGDDRRVEYEKESIVTKEQKLNTLQKFIESYKSRDLKVPGM